MNEVERVERAIKVLKEKGIIYPSDIFEYCNGEIDYDTIVLILDTISRVNPDPMNIDPPLDPKSSPLSKKSKVEVIEYHKGEYLIRLMEPDNDQTTIYGFDEELLRDLVKKIDRLLCENSKINDQLNPPRNDKKKLMVIFSGKGVPGKLNSV